MYFDIDIYLIYSKVHIKQPMSSCSIVVYYRRKKLIATFDHRRCVGGSLRTTCIFILFLNTYNFCVRADRYAEYLTLYLETVWLTVRNYNINS